MNTQMSYEELEVIIRKVVEACVKNRDHPVAIGPIPSKNLEVVVGLGPAFMSVLRESINGLTHEAILRAIVAGIEEEGLDFRLVKFFHTSDVGFIGNEAAKMSNSGIGIGIQSKGTAVIHQKDLYPLTNLELFPQAPLLTLEHYRAIGKNAARYGKQTYVDPIQPMNDCMCRPKYQLKAALMHIKETEACHVKKRPEDMTQYYQGQVR